MNMSSSETMIIIWNRNCKNEYYQTISSYEFLSDSKKIENAVGIDRIIFYISFFTISI